jgi:thiamine biosynthesis lipoprotein
MKIPPASNMPGAAAVQRSLASTSCASPVIEDSVEIPQFRSNRRELLRFARPTRGNRPAGESVASEDRRLSLRASDLLCVRRPAMGSFFEIRLGTQVPGGLELANRALDLIDRLEAQLTIYDEGSELSRLNATAHHGPVEVEEGLFGLLELAVELSRRTGGAFDVASGAISEAWGLIRGPRRLPDPQVLQQARERTGSHLIVLDRDRRTVCFRRAGVKLNLGGIGKGYAIDRVVALLRDHWWPTGSLIHGGQSSLFALRSPPGRIGRGWEIALRNPFVPERPIARIHLRDRGLGTSGNSFQCSEVEGRPIGHLLDPRTGEPASGPASVTVLAPSAAEADALSTAFYLLGPEAAADFVAQNPAVSAVFVTEGPADRSPRILSFGLDPMELELI